MSAHDSIEILNELKATSSSDDLYKKIIQLGKLSPYKCTWNFSEEDLVQGCQSVLYVRIRQEGNKLFFDFHSDALISMGLAALLCHFYSGRTAKEILVTPPQFLKELNLGHMLSMGRSNGLQSLYKKIIELTISICKAP